MGWKNAPIGAVALAIGIIAFVLVLGAREDVAENRADIEELAADELGPYPLQRVVNRVTGVDGPALEAGDTLRVEGKLCSRAENPVNVLTTLSWQAIGQTGTFVTIAVGIPQIRLPGCQFFREDCADRLQCVGPFVNPMPPEVVAASLELAMNGVTPRWRVVGFEETEAGEHEQFETESFAVVT